MRAGRAAVAALLLLLAGAALGEHDGRPLREGSSATLRIVEGGPGAPVGLELRTEPERTGRSELALFARPPGSPDAFRKRIVAAVEPGLYRLELPGREAGEWILTFRHGLGLDVYYATTDAVIDPDGAGAQEHELRFRGGLAPGAPRGLQLIGTAIFAGMAGMAFTLVGVVLSRLRRAQERIAASTD